MATVQHRRKRAIGFEVLERRETPSTIGGGAHLIHVQRVGSSGFQGTAREVVTTVGPLPSGELLSVGSINGRASQIGSFTGTVNTIIARDTVHSTSLAFLTTSSGDQLDLVFTGAFKASKSTVLRGNFSFTIFGGTGSFANATGGGRLTETLDFRSATASFSFTGKLTH
ncbi:MAG TPA: hypothetical protein VGZ22_22425, partial [Isosphaeraceae bacterium]|jgi:hypothetical protein|nr:hypothetical protein [Isosphaeraceae bacterium]